MSDAEILDWLESRKADVLAPGQPEKYERRRRDAWVVLTDDGAMAAATLREAVGRAEAAERADAASARRKAEARAKLTPDERALLGL